METDIIVLYENDKLILQTANIIANGLLKVVQRNDSERIVFSKTITNTDFIRVKANIAPGKYQVQIVTDSELITKNIIINNA
ncbi:MAG: hypothetical protein QM503_09200 [Bacteroidota bacterium]